MRQTMGFWSLWALVVGSQLGSSIFMAPATLAPYGLYGLWGYAISGFGAMILALTFAQLGSSPMGVGGPHVYILKAFGKHVAFFSGWAYWLISWISTTAVITSAVGYLVPWMSDSGTISRFVAELILLLATTLINLSGIRITGFVELFLTILKVIPLLFLPILALFYIRYDNFTLAQEWEYQSPSLLLSQTALITFWGFIGIETGIIPGASVKNASKTIPKAVATGTAFVFLVYAINALGIMGLFPGMTLVKDPAPYAKAAGFLLGESSFWPKIIGLMVALVCLGTLNAWILTSGQVALGLSEDGLLPKLFGKRNSYDAPWVAIVLTSLGMIPFLYVTLDQGSIAEQFRMITDIATLGFIAIYALVALSHWVLNLKKGQFSFLSSFGLLFCLVILLSSPLSHLLMVSFFGLSALPLYFLWYRRKS